MQKYEFRIGILGKFNFYMDILFFVIGGLGAGIWLVTKIIACLSRFFASEIFFEKLLYGGAAMSLGLCSLVVILSGVISYVMISAKFKILPLIISISQDTIEFVDKRGKYTLPISNITHILNRRNRIVLVWKINNAPITFTFSKNDFGNKALSKFKDYFKNLNQYIDEPLKINLIWKELKLNNLFRKNRFEYLIGKVHN